MDMRKPTQINVVAQEENHSWDEPVEIDAIARGGPSGRGRGSSRGRGGPGGHKAVGSSKQAKTCFYNDKFGLGAFRCEGTPCPFADAQLASKPSGNGNAGR